MLLPAAAEARVRVVATLPDLGAIAEAVGGDLVRVDILASPNEDPHYVDPRPSNVVTLSRADVLVYNGAELEVGWLPPLLHQSRNARLQAPDRSLDASTVVHLIGADGPVDRSMGDVHASGNPHFTRDPRAAALIGAALAQRFASADPDNAAVYAAQADAFRSAAEAFATEATARFAALPTEARQVVGYHESLAYLLRWLDLSAVAYVEPLPGVPPTPRHTASVLSALQAGGVRVIVQESYYPRQVTNTLAAQANATVVVLPGGVTPGDTYLGMMRSFTDALYGALAQP
jgi:zinc/manganese transport system substrate-binding protein